MSNDIWQSTPMVPTREMLRAAIKARHGKDAYILTPKQQMRRWEEEFLKQFEAALHAAPRFGS